MTTQRFADALALANKLHAGQTRKCTGTPYISHLLAVSGLVMEYGGSEDAAIAALLHDALEDQAANWAKLGVNLRHWISEVFGYHVLSIVEELTETDEDPKPPWRERKEKYIDHLRKASPEALLVAACDKLHNARTTLSDLREKGAEETWSKFNADPVSQEWWYNRLLVTFMMADVPRPLVNELKRVVDQLFDGTFKGPDNVPTRYRDVLQMVEEYNKTLRADHPGFNYCVLVQHHDGLLFQRSAFYEIWGEWLVVFGEHMKPDVHHMDEISYFAKFELEYPKRSEDIIWTDENLQHEMIKVYRRMQVIDYELDQHGVPTSKEHSELVDRMLKLIQSTGLLRDE